MLGPYLLQEFGLRKERAVVVKIDTEGFETRVLESLRPAWPLLGDIVFEMTVSSWEVHGIGVEEGLSTLRDVISANRYRVVTLPHTALGAGRGEAYWTLGEELVDPCRLPHVDPKVSLPANRHWHLGLANATVMHGHHLENLVRMHRKAVYPTDFTNSCSRTGGKVAHSCSPGSNELCGEPALRGLGTALLAGVGCQRRVAARSGSAGRLA